MSTFSKTKFKAIFGTKKRKLSAKPEAGGPDFLPQNSFLHKKFKNMFSFGRSKLSRTMVKDDQRALPGPGHYNSTKMLLQRKNPRCVIGSAKKTLGHRSEKTPGVGSYNLSKYWSLKNRPVGFSMAKKKRFRSTGVGLTRGTSRGWGPSPTSSTTKR